MSTLVSYLITLVMALFSPQVPTPKENTQLEIKNISIQITCDTKIYTQI
jgi:hypothetical protein